MTLSNETSNLTLAYLNTINNFSQMETNITDISRNVIKIDTLINSLFEKLDISENKLSDYETMLLDISNNIYN